jgi:hypothetical protein
MTRRWTCLVLLLAVNPVPAQEQPPLVRMSIHPQGEPVPALRYQLLPTLEEQQAGNAAVFYHRAILIRAQLRVEPGQDIKETDWLDAPLRDLPRDEVRTALARYRNVFREIDLAAHRRHTDWQLESRSEGVGLLLPEIQGMGSLASALALKARLEIAEGHYNQAVRSLQNGFDMARQVSQGPLLLQPLVGLAIADLMLRQVQDLIQQPGAPNLYWALTSLPHPLIDMREALQGERTLLTREFPELRRLLTERLTPDQARHLAEGIVSKALASGGPKRSPWERRALITYWTAKYYPAAKRFLREQGNSEQQVEATPAVQAVAILLVRRYEHVADELLKWFYVPYWQGQVGMQRAAAQLRREADALEMGLASSLGLISVSGFHRVYPAAADRERRIAALRCVEALRLYAAGHDGALAASLNDLGVPVPIDVITGRGFEYSIHDGKAVIGAPSPPNEEGYPRGLRMEITVVR